MRNVPYWLNIDSILYQYGCATRASLRTRELAIRELLPVSATAEYTYRTSGNRSRWPVRGFNPVCSEVALTGDFGALAPSSVDDVQLNNEDVGLVRRFAHKTTFTFWGEKS